MNTSTHAPARQVAAPPTVVALITCAGIHQDDTRKAYLLGVFNGYQAPTYPAQMPRLALYLSLTDGRGPTPLTVRLVDGADDDAPPLFAFDLPPVRFTVDPPAGAHYSPGSLSVTLSEGLQHR